MIFLDKPKFKCSETLHAGLYQKDLNISCLAVADPPINTTNMRWELHNQGNQTLETGLSGSKSGGYDAHVAAGVSVHFLKTINLYMPNEFGVEI